LKHLPFRLLLLCILLPPVMYVSSLQFLEVAVKRKSTAEVRSVLVSDSKSILEGRIKIQDEMRRNIDKYLASNFARRWGMLPIIAVTTKTGEWLYPDSAEKTLSLFDAQGFPPAVSFPEPTEALQVARENLRIMNDGIRLSVTVRIPRNSWLANSLLAFYLFVSSSVLYLVYRRSKNVALHQEMSARKAIESADQRLAEVQRNMETTAAKAATYEDEIELLRMDIELTSDKMRATEDEAVAEMERLENSLRENMTLKENLAAEVARLKAELERMESSRKPDEKKHRKQIDDTTKRFKTLYKNLDIHPRALEGFLALQRDLQLRAEELIHNMNQGTERLTVKRKVFSKKGAETAYECEFGYRGRIYWRQGTGAKIEVLAIGTKNTQPKDLAYLETL
jgi:septal ring factor EnvC (AmiA/AmiB activator)